MTEKPVSIRYGAYTLNFNTEEDFWKDFTDLARKMHGHGGVKKVIGEVAADWFLKYENKGGMDQFLDKEFVAEPNFASASYEQKLNYLKTLPTEKLESMRDEFHRLRIMTMALIDCNPQERKEFNKEFVAMYHNYKYR